MDKNLGGIAQQNYMNPNKVTSQTAMSYYEQHWDWYRAQF